MKRKSDILLPKTAEDVPNGGVYVQHVRCGKKTCKCVVAGRLHTAFYLLVRVEGRQRKKYIQKEDAGRIVALVAAARQHRSERREERRDAIEAYRAMRRFIASQFSRET